MSSLGESRGKVARASMADVARLAGVSSQTVSRISNGHDNVAPATRERVLESMRVLGYRPNGAARALKSGLFRTVGVIISTLETFGNMRTLDAIAQEAARSNFSVTLIPIAAPSIGQLAGAYNRLSEQAVDGVVIIFEMHLLDESEFTLPTGLPVVVVDSNAGSEFTVVDTDQIQGARLATQHLLDLGHRQVFHVAGPRAAFSASHRLDSWRATLVEAGIEPPEVLYGDWSTESGYRHGLALAQRQDVSAIFAANDQMALGVMRALHETGRRIPGDVSVVGFDDTEEASSFWPPLTTVHQDFTAVGRLSIQKLLRKIENGDEENDKHLVPTRLIVRASTAPRP